MGIKISEVFFGEFEGKKVSKFLIEEEGGICVAVINYGAAVTNIFVPDKNGILRDVVLGFTDLAGYVNAENIYMGSICGRYAGRIAGASFSCGDVVYHVPKNNDENCLHGGHKGFDKVYWNATISDTNDAVVFTYKSTDGQEGFPGSLTINVTYKIFEKALHIYYDAVTDKATPVNLTSHCYFNLSGGADEDIFNHELMINADQYLEVDDASIPTGKLLQTKNTDYDFGTLKLIGNLNELPMQYDNSWVLNTKADQPEIVALLKHDTSGIQMTVSSTEPSLHFYSGNFLGKDLHNTKQAGGYEKYAGLCLEAQHYPNSPNQPEFPGTILQPGENYTQQTIYSFTTN